ncbi:hypothetical protein K378_01377 [Streptomyces sp. Amel2xB2]|uniref:hypothetical protein n=1 Tax=Streptomyces sp. Amel2xB2 TaxID=1305829 RepID=UPI000DB9374C|nr:hypothetical protein [Streptomyces sp. Amel2xB2]RAJ70212.1 hypothetical protein K378_01377 [Streptomyces sp. Amel2xB2]
MWNQKARRIRDLAAWKNTLVDRLDDAREELKAERGARAIIARNFHAADRALGHEGAKNRGLTIRLDRALRTIARLRADAANRDRLIADQQRQLDDLLGLNSPAVEAGATWQERRDDKRPMYRSPIDGTTPTGEAVAP